MSDAAERRASALEMVERHRRLSDAGAIDAFGVRLRRMHDEESDHALRVSYAATLHRLDSLLRQVRALIGVPDAAARRRAGFDVT